MRKIMVITFGLFVLGFGCKKENSQTGQASLIKTQWILSYIQDSKTNAIINYPNDASRRISITFTDSLNFLSFSGICNGGLGTYSYSSVTDSIKIINLGLTKIACKYAEWESYTGDNLIDAYKYKINGNSLIIYSKGTYNLHFNH